MSEFSGYVVLEATFLGALQVTDTSFTPINSDALPTFRVCFFREAAQKGRLVPLVRDQRPDVDGNARLAVTRKQVRHVRSELREALIEQIRAERDFPFTDDPRHECRVRTELMR